MREGTFTDVSSTDEWLEWLGAITTHARELNAFGIPLDGIAPWHAEKWLIGEKVLIDFSRTGGPKVLCEITARRPHGDRLDLSLAQVPTEHPLA